MVDDPVAAAGARKMCSSAHSIACGSWLIQLNVQFCAWYIMRIMFNPVAAICVDCNLNTGDYFCISTRLSSSQKLE